MKNVFLLLIISISVNCLAQTAENDFGKISINVVLPESKDIPAEAKQLLETKLKQIVTKYGTADNGLSERFVITAKTSVIQKDIANSNPPRISQKLEVTFIIGDVMENKVYETASLEFSGMGTNETKAYISAFQNISIGNKIFAEMLENAKGKIMQYYNSNCDEYFKRAQVLETKQQFDEAVYVLLQVPTVSENCYNRAQDLATKILIKKINFEAETLLKQAQTQWTNANTPENATATLEILSKINLYADCQPQVEQLISEINNKLREDEKRAWEFKMQQYKDAKEKEQRDFEFMAKKYDDAKEKEQRDFEFKVKQHDDSQELSKRRIEATRQVATEFAKNLPKVINITKIVTLW